MTSPTLSQFSAALRQRNVARPTHYYVEIIPPASFSTKFKDSFGPIDPRLVSMWCSQAMTPQTTISTKDDYLENGVRRKFAFDQDYQNLTLHFYLDQDFDIQRFFDQWKQAIVPTRRYFNYPADYTAESLNLFIINQEGEPTYKYEYSRIFPKSVNSVELSYASGAAVASFSVDFVFEEVFYTSMFSGETSKPQKQVEAKPTALNMEISQSINQSKVGVFDEQGNHAYSPI